MTPLKKEEKHVFDVLHEQRKVEKFKVYISKDFWSRIGVENGDQVDVACWEMTGEIRITPIKSKVVARRRFP